MGTFGTAAIAAHQIAVNVACISYMVPLGLAMAATVRVGLAAGAGNRSGVRRAGYTALAASTAFMALSGLIIAVGHGALARLYFSAADTANAEAIALTASFLLVAAGFQIFDGIQVTAALALRGLKDAHTPMGLTAICYWLLGIPACFGLSKGLGLGGIGVWYGLAFALFMAATLLCGRFYFLTHGTAVAPPVGRD
jgi:multidrug resistance protein, MATE family